LYTGTSKIENWKHFDTKSKLCMLTYYRTPTSPQHKYWLLSEIDELQIVAASALRLCGAHPFPIFFGQRCLTSNFFLSTAANPPETRCKPKYTSPYILTNGDTSSAPWCKSSLFPHQLPISSAALSLAFFIQCLYLYFILFHSNFTTMPWSWDWLQVSCVHGSLDVGKRVGVRGVQTVWRHSAGISPTGYHSKLHLYNEEIASDWCSLCLSLLFKERIRFVRQKDEWCHGLPMRQVTQYLFTLKGTVFTPPLVPKLRKNNSCFCAQSSKLDSDMTL
jgi:hypothetical protein